MIDRLESELLDYRVLASFNLEQITGRRGVFYPADPESSRRRAIAKLRDRLADGELGPPNSPRLNQRGRATSIPAIR